MSADSKDWVAKFKRRTLRNVQEAFADHLADLMAGCEALCESPIEVAMLYALRGSLVSSDGFYGLPVEFHPLRFQRWPEAPAPFKALWVLPQCQIGLYRADFGILIDEREKQRWLAVECDGHDFHERTKEQARRDRSRDRWMMLNGVQVVRFTGQEIFQDPGKCAESIHETIYHMMMGDI